MRSILEHAETKCHSSADTVCLNECHTVPNKMWESKETLSFIFLHTDLHKPLRERHIILLTRNQLLNLSFTFL